MSINSKIVPKGFDFSPEIWGESFKNNTPLVVVPFISHKCNINCIYCMMKEDREAYKGDGFSLDEHKKIIKDCHELGCRTVVITGIGEPFLDQLFYDFNTKSFPLIEYAQSLGMYTIVFTNGYFITEEIAKQLYKLDVSLILKLSSLDEKVFEKLNGSPIQFITYKDLNGEDISIPKYLYNLFSAGFRSTIEGNTTRLIADIIITKLNIREIPNILDFSFRNNMLACIDPLVVKSAAEDNYSELGITQEENRELYASIKETFSSYDMTMFDLSNCIIHHNGFVYDLDGNVRRCLSVPFNDGNVKNKSVKELWYKLSKDKINATKEYENVKFEDIFGKCPGRCFYNGIHN